MAGPPSVAQLESRLKQLIRRWERFAANDPEVRLPPETERVAMEQMLREVSREEAHTAVERFRLEQLLHKFATYNGMWQRQLREREEARSRSGAAARERAAAAALESNAGQPASVSGGEADLRTLHRQYLSALESSGSRASIGFDRFKQALEGQRAALEGRGAVVEGFELAQEEGKIKVRARVRRGR